MTTLPAELKLPKPVLEALQPLFDLLPPDAAMPKLRGGEAVHVETVTELLKNPALAGPGIAAGLWLYVDNLDKAHAIAQSFPDPTSSLWHAVVHRRDGDFSNSLYWMRRAQGHPLLRELAPEALVQAVSRANGRDIPELIERQRREWCRLFSHCCS